MNKAVGPGRHSAAPGELVSWVTASSAHECVSSNWIGAIICIEIVLTAVTLLRLDLNKMIAKALTAVHACCSSYL